MNIMDEKLNDYEEEKIILAKQKQEIEIRLEKNAIAHKFKL